MTSRTTAVPSCRLLQPFLVLAQEHVLYRETDSRWWSQGVPSSSYQLPIFVIDALWFFQLEACAFNYSSDPSLLFFFPLFYSLRLIILNEKMKPEAIRLRSTDSRRRSLMCWNTARRYFRVASSFWRIKLVSLGSEVTWASGLKRLGKQKFL